MRGEEVETGNGENYFEKCCCQEKPRIKEVGEGIKRGFFKREIC